MSRGFAFKLGGETGQDGVVDHVSGVGDAGGLCQAEKHTRADNTDNTVAGTPQNVEEEPLKSRDQRIRRKRRRRRASCSVTVDTEPHLLLSFAGGVGGQAGVFPRILQLCLRYLQNPACRFQLQTSKPF